MLKSEPEVRKPCMEWTGYFKKLLECGRQDRGQISDAVEPIGNGRALGVFPPIPFKLSYNLCTMKLMYFSVSFGVFDVSPVTTSTIKMKNIYKTP